MHKLGLIGGCGPESTVPYYLGVVNGVRERVGERFFPNMTIESLSCFDVMPLAAEGRYDELADYLSRGIDSLVAAGCDVGAIGCVTGHAVFDRVAERSPIPLVSLVDATRDAILAGGYRAVLVLGTYATMKRPFLKGPIIHSHVAVVTPPEGEKLWLQEAISSELELGIVRDETVARFKAIVDHAADEGAQAVVLGCTELPMLAERCELPVPAVDAMRCHIDALVDAVMAE